MPPGRGLRAKCGDYGGRCLVAGTADEIHVDELDAMLELYEAGAAARRDQVQVLRGAVAGEPYCGYAVAESELAFASALASSDGLAWVEFREVTPELSMQIDGSTRFKFQLGLDGTAWASLVDLGCHSDPEVPLTRL